MNHLNDEELESILLGQGPEPAHLAECPSCRARLDEKRAVRRRLKQAFDGVAPSVNFAAGLRERLAARLGESPARPAESRRSRPILFPRFVWPILAAAAAVLVVAVPLVVHLMTPAQAMAAQEELARIHRAHESGEARLDLDEQGLIDHLKSHCGSAPVPLRLGGEESVCGRCIDRLRGHPVGSYVLRTPKGTVSVIVATESPESLKLRHRSQRDGRTVWTCGYEACNMAGVQAGDLSYYAVGEAPHDFLVELLLRIVPCPCPPGQCRCD